MYGTEFFRGGLLSNNATNVTLPKAQSTGGSSLRILSLEEWKWLKNNSDSRVIRRRKGVIYIIKMAVTKSQFSSVVSFVFISGADLGGECRGWGAPPPPPPPRDDLWFSNSTGILQKKKKKKLCGLWCWSRVRDECTPPKRNPGSAPVFRVIKTIVCKASHPNLPPCNKCWY